METHIFLAHLSQRLIGELIEYPCSGVRRSSSYVVHNFKHLLLCPIKAKFNVEHSCEPSLIIRETP